MRLLNKPHRLIGWLLGVPERNSQAASTVPSARPAAGFGGGRVKAADLPEGLQGFIRAALVEAYVRGIFVNGDYYRAHAQVVAAAASLGLLTTETPEGFTRTYRPTQAGMAWCQA